MKQLYLSALLLLLTIVPSGMTYSYEDDYYEEDVILACDNNDETAPRAPFMTPEQFSDNAIIASRTFTEGRTISFPVRFTYGCPLPNVAQWLFKDNMVDPDADKRYSIDLPSFSLTISRARLNDSGEYRFIVKNSEGVLEFVFIVNVKAKPPKPMKIKTPKTPGAPYWCGLAPYADPRCNCLYFDFEVGKNLAISCDLCANETVLVEWYSGREGAGGVKPVTENLDTRMAITESTNSSTLKIEFLLAKDDGTIYECRAKNKYGNFSFRWHLRQIESASPVISPPYIYGVVNSTVQVGSSTKLICNIAFTGDTLLSETIWLRGDFSKLVGMLDNNSNESLTKSPVYLIPKFIETFPEYRKDVADNVQELHFDKVDNADYGPYTCYYKNTVGASARIVWLLKKQTESEPDYIMPIALGAGVGGIILLVAVVILTVLFCRRRSVGFRPVKKRIIVMTNNDFYKDGIQDHEIRIEIARSGRNPNQHAMTTAVARSKYYIEVDPRWEIGRNKIVLGEPIGDGNIGNVVSGKLLDHYGERSRDVAVKMLRDDATDDDMLQLIKELMLLKQVGAHPNVINFFGCSTQDGPILVVVELARFGNLRDFLRRHRPPEIEADYCLPSPTRVVSAVSEWSVTTMSAFSTTSNEGTMAPLMFEGNVTLTYRQLVEFAQQIAKGMEYLSLKGCIHRDLAARNVLVGDNFQLKVSDFGLTRKVSNISTDYYRRGNVAARLPLKWMAPESLLELKYTTKSDVWSYGVLLWEIYSLGESPYRDLSGFEEIIEFVVQQGRRLDRPKYAPDDLYDQLFKRCWNELSEARPSFQQIRSFLDGYGQCVANVPLGSVPVQSPPLTPNTMASLAVKITDSHQNRLPSINEPEEEKPGSTKDELFIVDEENSRSSVHDNDSGESGCLSDYQNISSNPPSSPGNVTFVDSQYGSTLLATHNLKQVNADDSNNHKNDNGSVLRDNETSSDSTTLQNEAPRSVELFTNGPTIHPLT